MLGRSTTAAGALIGLASLIGVGLGVLGVYGQLTAADCVGPCTIWWLHLPKLLLGAGGLLAARSLVRWAP